MSKLTSVIEKIDAANSLDPNITLVGGEEIPKELAYSQRMTRTLNNFIANPSEALQIAARAQHIERWKSARSDYPDGRAGYKKWRSELGLFHASRCAELMEEVGFSEGEIERVKYLVQKRGLKRDEHTQALEDVICLVFLKYYFDDFAAKHSDEKIVDIVQKTWKKMSEKGHEAALKLKYSEKTGKLVTLALQG